MSEKSEDAHGEGGEKKGGGKKIIILVLLLVLIGGGGAGAYFVLGGSKDAKKAGEGEEEHLEEEHPKHLVLAPLDPPFIVNLAGSGSFLKATIWLEYDLDQAKKLEEDAHGGGGHGSGGSGGGDAGPPKLEGILKSKEPLIRDVVIRVLSSKTVDEALSVEVRDSVKEEIVEAINDVIGNGDGPVSSVLFTEFIVQ